MNICEYLYNHLPATIKPKYVGEIPSQTTEGVAISLSGGDDSFRYFGHGNPVLQPTIRFVVRTDKYEKGATFAEVVASTFDKYHDGEHGIMGIWLQGNVNYLGVTEEKLHEFEVNFKSMIIEKE